MDSRSESNKRDVYARVTDEIVRAIEVGVAKFAMPWHRVGNGMPSNAATGNRYRGVNVLSLWTASRRSGYALPYWASYQQWRTLGAQVRKGEQGTIIVFYLREDEKPIPVGNEQADRAKVLLRYSMVFNAEQVEGWTRPILVATNSDGQLALVETFVSVIGADIRYGGDRAYYSPKFDCIHMPERGDFFDTKAGSRLEAFYSVLLHEHIHWSGHASRINRDLSGKFRSDAYAMEELVAELGAAFLCATLSISATPRPDHASYVASWLKVLKGQKTAIFTAASMAAIACDYLEETFVQNDAETSAIHV